MTETACNQRASWVPDYGEAHQLLSLAREMLLQRGPSVTLSEIALAAGTSDGESRCFDRVRLLLTWRLADLFDIARGLPQPQRQPTEVAHGLWADRVRDIVLEQLGRSALSLHTVARMLAVSPRTLQRRLADEGTSWRAVLDATRRQRVTTLMREGATTDLAAAQVGYAGSRALRRALRRWRGAPLPAGDRG
jgi:AraC-like DNA-binding protein